MLLKLQKCNLETKKLRNKTLLNDRANIKNIL